MVKAQKLEGILFKSIINSVVLCVTAKITYEKIVFSSYATEIHKDSTEIHGGVIFKKKILKVLFTSPNHNSQKREEYHRGLEVQPKPPVNNSEKHCRNRLLWFATSG
jgi:hypothetical protein